MLGASSERKLTNCQVQGWAPPNSIEKHFKRLKSDQGHILHSKSYECVRSRNSFTVRLRSERQEHTREYGQIEFFFQCKQMCFCLSSTCNCSVHNLVVVTRLHECDNISCINDSVTNGTLSFNRCVQFTSVSHFSLAMCRVCVFFSN